MIRELEKLRRLAMALLLVLLSAWLPSHPANALSRIKDLADVEGIRDNMLVGYGLVVGLDGTGDTLRNSPFTQQSLEAMLERLGVNTRGTNIKTANVAAVMVTANLPPFATQGSRMDVIISSLGDADSLRGGMLLVTPLIGADGETYAVAQGPIAIGGFSASGQGSSVTKGVTTSGRIANGAIIEREIDFELASMDTLRLSLRSPDLTTALRMAQAINTYLGSSAANPLNPTTVSLSIPANYSGNIISLLTEIEQLRIEPDLPARVVIDEQSGIIVIGHEVRVSQVAIAQGNLTISVKESPQVSQPTAFSQGGETTTVPRTEIDIDDSSDSRLLVLEVGVTLQALVDGLNALGVGPQDMIAILQAIKAAGALHAEVEVM